MDLRIISHFGVNPRTFLRSFCGLPGYFWDLIQYKKMEKNVLNSLPIREYYPIIYERYSQAGETTGHYFHQDLWAAQKIFRANPSRHVDIGSSLASFVAHLLVFRKVEVIDIRPISSEIPGLNFLCGDATNLDIFGTDSVESVSSLHAAEHFGLGRYGDPIDPVAHLKFMSSLSRILRPGGRLYFSVPCGCERLCFNAHRIFSPKTVIAGFSKLKLVSFSCVKDDGKFYENCPLEYVSKEKYGCGLFEFTK